MALRVLLALAACCQAATGGEAMAPAIVLENDYVTYTISPNGTNLSLTDKATGKNLLVATARSPFLVLRKGKATVIPHACRLANGRLAASLARGAVTASVKVAAKEHYLVFEVESVSDPAVEELWLLNLAVGPGKYVSGMSGVAADEESAVAVRALNLQARGIVGGRPPRISARCYRNHGLVGAKVALVVCTADKLRDTLKEVVRSEGLPFNPLGGPFALDAQENRGSYVFAAVSEANVDEWIALCKRAGIAQLHFHPWWQSLGHYEPRKGLFPSGLAGMKAAVAKVHAAGLKAGLHTLTGCISPHDPWVRPVPDRRLATDAAFTLAADIDLAATTVPATEPPGEFDTVWAYGSHGNVLRIGDELIQYSGISRQAPGGFTGCRRGAFKTKAAPHKKGETVAHMFVRYGSFLPDESSTLVDEVAEAIARVFNTCGFDMIYMDGAEGMQGGWHGVARMREALFRKIGRPCLVEASEWGYHSWPFHSRIGAWDHPKWGLKRFIDSHCAATERYRRSTLLPAQLGWWAILGASADHDAESPDEIEYLCAKALALDAPMSFQTVNPTRPWNARQSEYLDLIGRYERLRLANYFPEAVRRRLRTPGEEFRLVQGPGGEWQFVPTDYLTHKVTALDDGSARWTVRNRFGAQPLKLRLVALYGVEPYDSPDALVLADLAREDEFALRAAAKGVTHGLAPARERVKVGSVSGCYTATSNRPERRGAWSRTGKTFQPQADLRKFGAIGLWVHGDAKGEVLNIQLANPPQYYRTLDEHYVAVDFEGWRYFELLLRERDADRYHLYQWPYPGHYAVYRAPLVRNHVSELNLYFNNLPPGQSVRCYLSAIKALRVARTKLRDPAVEVGGKRLVFPVELESGSYIEMFSPSDCRLYDPRGALIERLKPQGQVPTLAAGDNIVRLTCEGPQGYRTRASVTIIASGEPFGR